MVQFNRSANPLPTDYWKLDRPPWSVLQLKQSLLTAGFYFKDTGIKSRLLTLLSRRQRDLLSWDAYKVEQLEAWCDQRGIAVDDECNREDIVTILETADNHSTFTCSLDLPPELRNRIYSIHFASFPALELPTTPPVTQVSRQLRQETLSLFYQSCKVIIALTPNDKSTNNILRLQRRPPHGSSIQFTKFTERFFMHLPERFLGLLRRFQIDGVVNVNVADCVNATWNVDFGSARNQASIFLDLSDLGTQSVSMGYKAETNAADQMVKAELVAIAAREGQSKLRREDLEAFRRMFVP